MSCHTLPQSPFPHPVCSFLFQGSHLTHLWGSQMFSHRRFLWLGTISCMVCLRSRTNNCRIVWLSIWKDRRLDTLKNFSPSLSRFFSLICEDYPRGVLLSFLLENWFQSNHLPCPPGLPPQFLTTAFSWKHSSVCKRSIGLIVEMDSTCTSTPSIRILLRQSSTRASWMPSRTRVSTPRTPAKPVCSYFLWTQWTETSAVQPTSKKCQRNSPNSNTGTGDRTTSSSTCTRALGRTTMKMKWALTLEKPS